MNIWGQYCLQNKHRAHTIPIGVSTVPTNALEYLLPTLTKESIAINEIMKVLTSKIFEFEKLEENISGDELWSQNTTPKCGIHD